MEFNGISFGYPDQCCQCGASTACTEPLKLMVNPYYKAGNHFRLMLIGQDPTIFEKRERVKQVLMLDKENGQLRRWLEDVFGKENLNKYTVYATNLIKCTFPQPPSKYKGKEFLRPYFDCCKSHLISEVQNYKPTLVISFGEPAHRYFTSIFDNKTAIKDDMQSAFGVGDKFFKAKVGEITFDYSPSLHIKTFRVAEVYGEKIKKFKATLGTLLEDFK